MGPTHETTEDVLSEVEDPIGSPVGGQIPPFRITVDSYQRGSPVLFNMTVRRGDAVWQIRRRYRQVWAVHQSLEQGLRGAGLHSDLPRPPPRKTLRSSVFGQLDTRFLEERARRLEEYIQALLDFIPCVEQCEALYNFLCLVNQPRRDLDLLHGEIVGGGAPPVDAAAIAKLPRKGAGIARPTSAAAAAQVLEPMVEAPEPTAADEAADTGIPKKVAICVICQEPNDPSADIRELPCGHEFHFHCIEQWLRRRNTCCMCNGPGVLSAPRLI